MGEILFRSVPDGAIAIRYAGDEFIVFLPEGSEESTREAMEEIDTHLSRFNAAGIEPFTLSVAMGYTKWQPKDDAESFLKRMDEKMYREKRRFHLEREKATDRTKNYSE